MLQFLKKDENKHLCPLVYQDINVFAKQQLDPDDSFLPPFPKVNAYLFVCHVYSSLDD